MKGANNSPAEILNEVLGIATGLGLIFFVTSPLAIPAIALTIVLAAPIIVLTAVVGAIATPLVGVAWLTRKLWLPRSPRTYTSPDVPPTPVPQHVTPGRPRSEDLEPVE